MVRYMKLLLLAFGILFSDSRDYFRNFTMCAALAERCSFEAFTTVFAVNFPVYEPSVFSLQPSRS